MRSYRAVTEDWSICVYRKCEKNVLLFCVCLLHSSETAHIHRPVLNDWSEYNGQKCAAAAHHYMHTFHVTLPHIWVFWAVYCLCWKRNFFFVIVVVSIWQKSVVLVCTAICIILAAHVVRVTC